MSWILLTECEHFETNTWQFLFWSGERLHLALDSIHRILMLRNQHLAVFVFARQAPVSCLGFYSQNVDVLRPTLGSLLFWSGGCLHLALVSIHRIVMLRNQHLAVFVLVRRAPASSFGSRRFDRRRVFPVVAKIKGRGFQNHKVRGSIPGSPLSS